MTISIRVSIGVSILIAIGIPIGVTVGVSIAGGLGRPRCWNFLDLLAVHVLSILMSKLVILEKQKIGMLLGPTSSLVIARPWAWNA